MATLGRVRWKGVGENGRGFGGRMENCRMFAPGQLSGIRIKTCGNWFDFTVFFGKLDFGLGQHCNKTKQNE